MLLHIQLLRDDHLHFLIPPNLPAATLALTQSVLAPATLPPPPAKPSLIKWSSTISDTDSPILTLSLPSSSGLPKQIVWHRKGDYLASVCELYDLYPDDFLDAEFTTLISWIGDGSRLDAPNFQTPFAGAFRESQRIRSTRPIPSYKVSLLRRGKLLSAHPHVFVAYTCTRLRNMCDCMTWQHRS